MNNRETGASVRAHRIAVVKEIIEGYDITPDELFPSEPIQPEFKVGDWVIGKDGYLPKEAKEVKFVSNNFVKYDDQQMPFMWIRHATPEEIALATKPKVLFTTHDGVDIIDESTQVYVLDLDLDIWLTVNHIACEVNHLMMDSRKIFSTSAARDEYRILNQPCLSLEDLYVLDEKRHPEGAARKGNNLVVVGKDKLIELIKSKLGIK